MALGLVKGEHAFGVRLPANAQGVVHGVADLGVMTTGRKPYVLLYATLVFTANGASAAVSPPPAAVAGEFAALPEPTSSFGAAVSDGWLYVYGGHVVRTHVYYHRSRLRALSSPESG